MSTIKRDALYMAVAGKAIERGLSASLQDGHVLIEYPTKTSDATDHLHKQVIRNLVDRLTPDASCHLKSVDSGFEVTVEFPAKPEAKGLVAPEWVSDLTAEEKLEMIRQLVA